LAIEKTVIEMIFNQIPKLVEDEFDRRSNVHEKTGSKYYKHACFKIN